MLNEMKPELQLTRRAATMLQPGALETALANADSLGELKVFQTDCKALRDVLKTRGAALRDLNSLSAYRIRAAMRAGSILKKTVRPRGAGNTRLPEDVSKMQSSRWQATAEIPLSTLDRFEHTCNEKEVEATEAGLRGFHSAEVGSGRDLQPPPPAKGTYSGIVIDPPWPMTMMERAKRPMQGGWVYPTMSEDEMAALELPAAEACHLYCWTTHKHLPMALRLVEAWGFKYECLMTWVKNVGFTPFSWMRTTEHVLFCRRGSMDVQRMGLPLHFHAKAREHSRKPDEFYDLVRQATPGPRIDMFGREEREGFTVWGDEPAKFQEAAS